MKAPAAPAGRYRVRLDTVTPLAIREHGSRRWRRNELTGSVLASSLALTTGRRAGVDIPIADLRIEVVEAHGESTADRLRGHDARGSMSVVGWDGWMVLDVNAPALWLLETAARGLGVGGRGAFGFGQVRVVRLPAEVRADVLEAFADVAEPPSGARRALTVDSLPARPPDVPLPAVTPHALDQFAHRILGRTLPPRDERGALRAEVRPALEQLVRMSAPERPYRGRMSARIPDATTWLGPRTVLGDDRSARLRLVVGTRPGETTPSVVTVLPLFDCAPPRAPGHIRPPLPPLPSRQ
jgi:hypothetical protein